MNSGPKNLDHSEFDRWHKIGMEAVECESWLYALECLSKAVQADPDHRSARKQKHRASRRVHKQNGGLKKAETLKLTAIKSRVIAAEARGDWNSVDTLAEDVLARNPWDAGMFAAVARAAEKRQALDIAEYSWVCANKIDGKQVKWLRALGDLLHHVGRHEDAKGCYAKIQQIDPSTRGGEELMHAVDVATLLRDGGIHLRRTDESTNDHSALARRPDESSQAMNEADRSDTLKLLAQQIQKAEAFVQNDQLGQAFEQYEKVSQQMPDNQAVQDRSADIHLALLRKRASSAAAAAMEHPNTDRLVKSAAQHAAKCQQTEFDVLQGRVKRDPSNLLQTFRLADLCRRMGRLDQAVKLFEKCVGDKNLHAESLIGMGECCLKSNKAGIGRRHLETALKMIDAESRPNSVKLAHYWLGRYFEAARATPQATWHYQRVASLDQRFRDISVRLNRVQQEAAATTTDNG
ncbi:MAG: tetratricopeptide repeat protein [Fuerstiella sp.]